MKVSFDSTPYVKFFIFFVLIGPWYMSLQRFLHTHAAIDALTLFFVSALEIWVAISAVKSLIAKTKNK